MIDEREELDPMDPQDDEQEGEFDGEEVDLDESMDGDAASALASAGFGTDEDYGGFGDDPTCDIGCYEE